MRKELNADLQLLMITMFWGASCILTKVGLGGIREFNLIALRFVLAFLLAVVVFRRKLSKIDRKTFGYSAILGTILFVVLVFMTFGIKNTTASNAGFLTCLAGIFVPIISYLVFKQKIEKKILVSVVAAFIGVYLITVNGKIQFNIGDMLCIMCSAAFAVHIIVTGMLTQKVDSITLGVCQLGFVGLYSSVFTLLLEVPKLPDSMTSWLVVLALSIFCSGIGFIVQTTAQKHTSATHAGLIFTLEPAFAVLFAFVFLGELLTIKGCAGQLILFFSIVLIEIDIKEIQKKFK